MSKIIGPYYPLILLYFKLFLLRLLGGIPNFFSISVLFSFRLFLNEIVCGNDGTQWEEDEWRLYSTSALRFNGHSSLKNTRSPQSGVSLDSLSLPSSKSLQDYVPPG